MRLNGTARWISAVAGSVVAGALLTSAVFAGIRWLSVVDAHVSRSEALILENQARYIETQRWQDRMERVHIWLVRVMCDEIIQRGEIPPPDCAGLPLPRLQGH